MILILKNLLFTLLVPGAVAGWVPWLIVRDSPVRSGALFLTSIALFVLGGAIYTWCVWDFAAFGRGTPALIDAPKKLVVRGLYRYTRNPMYVGVLTLILAWLALFPSSRLVIYVGAVGLGFHLYVLLYEEPHLEREFGESYLDYKSQVSRWLPTPP